MSNTNSGYDFIFRAHPNVYAQWAQLTAMTMGTMNGRDTLLSQVIWENDALLRVLYHWESSCALERCCGFYAAGRPALTPGCEAADQRDITTVYELVSRGRRVVRVAAFGKRGGRRHSRHAAGAARTGR